MYKLKLTGNTKSDNLLSSYMDALATTASGSLGTEPGKREAIRDYYVKKGLNSADAEDLMKIYLPNGWEWRVK